MTSDIKILRNLWGYLWPKDMPAVRLRFVLACIFLLFSKFAYVSVPYLFKLVIDSLDQPSFEQAKDILWILPAWLILGYVLIRTLSLVFAEVQTAVFAKITQRAMRQVANTVFKYLHNLSLRFHLDRQTGGLSRAIERGIKGIETLMLFLSFNIIPTLVEIIIVAVVLSFLYGLKFALVSMVTLVIYISYTLWLTEYRIKFIRMMNANDSEANTKAIDSLLNYETVKYFGNESHESARYDVALEKYEDAAIKSKLSLAFLNIGQSCIISAGLAIIMLMAGQAIIDGTMTVGDFVAINVFVIQLYIPLFNLGFAYREVKISLVNMEYMFSLLDVPQEVADSTKSKKLKVKGGAVEFRNVQFHYFANRTILRGISFKVPAGKTTAIVGASGSGKSTISRLLFRFYDATEGQIIIDGQDIREVKQDSLRQAIGVVPQDTVLFNDTIGYNIAYGCPNATQEEVYEASKHARIHEFIMSLPSKYDTMVGERGLKLSGGEKQRVAIARTLLKKPSIFLFDEATSALDSRTEKQIQLSLRELSKDFTTLIIAHRLSTVVDADEIIVLDHGEIIERGTHTALLSQDGMYAKMWQRQQRDVSEASA